MVYHTFIDRNLIWSEDFTPNMSLVLCVYVCICVSCICVYVGAQVDNVCIFVHIGQRKILGVWFFHSPVYSFEARSLTGLELRWQPVSSTNLSVYTQSSAWASVLTWGAGMQTQVFMLIQRTLISLPHQQV